MLCHLAISLDKNRKIVTLLLFNNFKTTDVKYYLNSPPDLPYSPSGLYPSVEKYSNKIYSTKCPAVATIHSRLYYVNSFLDVDIEFGVKNNELHYNYYFTKEHPNFPDMHDFCKGVIKIAKTKGQINLQIFSPYIFVTDNKDVEIVSLPPNIDCENCVYVAGGLKPYYWLRNLNAAFLLDDETKIAKVKLRIDKPMSLFYFNKPVNLQYMEATEKIKTYAQSTNNIVAFRNKLEKYYMNVVSRRPRKLLS